MTNIWSKWLSQIRSACRVTDSRASKRAGRKTLRNRLAVERLEDRAVPAVALTFVNDTWHLFLDADASSSPTVGDIVSSANDTGPLTAYIYGVTAFGTVTSGPGITSPTSVSGAATINDAIANTTALGTVAVLEGTYNEQVTVNKSLTLLGKQAGVDARTRTGVPESVVGSAGGAFQFTANDIVLDGFTVSGVTGGLNAGVSASGVAGYTIRNNIITNNVIGVFANPSGTSLIERNLFDGNNNPGPSGGSGLYSDSSTGLTIDNNEFRNQIINNPIIFGATATVAHTNLTVTNNYIHDNVSGIYALGISGGTFQGNTITTNGTATALTFGGSDTNVNVLNNDLSNNARGLRIANFQDAAFVGPNSNITAHFNSFADDSDFGVGNIDPGTAVNGYTGTLDVSRNWWGAISGPTSASNPGGLGSMLRNDFSGDPITFRPWLIYGTDDDSAAPGFQLPTSIPVTAGGDVSAADNDYTRLANAIAAAVSGQTFTLSGTFDWTRPFSSAAWAKGVDGVAGNGDDYDIVVPANINNVTVTAPALGSATVQGPGDLANVDFEGVLAFIDPTGINPGRGGPNTGWTISNLQIFDFDNAIQYDTITQDRFNDTTITNNHIRVARDLNDLVAPNDPSQNIGIYFGFGTNQTISNNTIDIPGDGVRDSAMGGFSGTYGIQCATSGGAVYDGLMITGNTINVLHAQSTDPERVVGIWDNTDGTSSNITISNNTFHDLAAGNDPTLNDQIAFRLTSPSSATTTILYQNNQVSGAHVGFQYFSTYDNTGTQPVQFLGNTLTNVFIGFDFANGAKTVNALSGNSVTGTGSTGAGIAVGAGSIVSVLGGSFTNTGVGIDVNGGTALIQGVNLNNDSIAGLRLQNGAKVDAGDTSNSNSTGLGTSAGNNNFESYLPASPGLAIIDLNTDLVFTGVFTAAPPDMKAQNNIFASPSLAFIEQVVDHDVDVATQGFVDFSGPQPGANDAPVAANGTLTTAEDTGASGTLVATDVDSPTLTYSVVNQSGAHGVVTITNAATGAYSYTPDLNYNGTASFTFKANDGTADSNTATVSITVTAVNDPPVASSPSLTTGEDVVLDVDLRALVSDVETADNDLIFAVGSAVNGTVILLPDGHTARFTPAANYSGPASFTYSVTDTGDPVGTSANAITVGPTSVSVAVTAVNDAPVVNNQSFTVPENSPNGTIVGTVAASDIDGPALVYSIIGGNTGGAFAINPATGQITVANMGALDFETTPVFSLTVRVSDGALTDTATATIGLIDVAEVPPVLPPPVTPVPLSLFAVGTGAGVQGQVHVFEAVSGNLRFNLLPYGAVYSGGVTVATGDVTGDGTLDVITAGGGIVKVFDGTNGAEIRSFFAYAGFTGEIAVAAGDINGDTKADIITGSSINAHVKAFDGATGAEIRSFLAYTGFTGAVNVAIGDVNHDGTGDIITGAGVNAHVKVFDGISGAEIRSFLAYAGFPGAVNVAAGDVNGDGFVDIITGAGAGAGTRVNVFSGADNSTLSSFFAYDGFSGGVRVGSADLDGDLMADILTGVGPGAGPHVKGFNGLTGTELRSFFAFDPSFTGGVFVGGK